MWRAFNTALSISNAWVSEPWWFTLETLLCEFEWTRFSAAGVSTNDEKNDESICPFPSADPISREEPCDRGAVVSAWEVLQEVRKLPELGMEDRALCTTSWGCDLFDDMLTRYRYDEDRTDWSEKKIRIVHIEEYINVHYLGVGKAARSGVRIRRDGRRRNFCAEDRFGRALVAVGADVHDKFVSGTADFNGPPLAATFTVRFWGVEPSAATILLALDPCRNSRRRTSFEFCVCRERSRSSSTLCSLSASPRVWRICEFVDWLKIPEYMNELHMLVRTIWGDDKHTLVRK